LLIVSGLRAGSTQRRQLLLAQPALLALPPQQVAQE
jgi:hypothetical protein